MQMLQENLSNYNNTIDDIVNTEFRLKANQWYDLVKKHFNYVT